jgi:1-deoxy-D-xylulose-5-phosphate reductoisomerase
MRILVFGATGSIGSQVLNTIKKLNYQLVGISFYHNAKAARKIKAPYCYSPIDDQNSNVHDYRELIGKSKPDLIVNAVVGSAGLRLTLLTIEKGIDLALANKESIVMAGQFIMPLAKKKHVNIYPIDSEHSALYKIIQMYGNNYKKIYITASGGPFYHYTTEEIKRVTFKRAIKHPK